MRSRISEWLQQLRHKSARHWWTAAALLAGLFIVNPYLDIYLNLRGVEIWLFQALSQLSTNPFRPRSVTLVLIGDSDYWLGALAARAPLKRDYLARLVDALDRSKAAVLALDIDLRSPDPSRIYIPPDYQSETDTLIAALRRAAQHHKIVLARSIGLNAQGSYVVEADQYEAYGICAAPVAGRAAASNISCGYVSLPGDIRTVPGSIQLGSGGRLDSFALATARAASPRSAALAEGMNFGSYMPLQAWVGAGLVLDARSVMRSPAAIQSIGAGAIVIVGGNWHSLAFQRGPPIDLHDTPVGPLTGAAIHANFTEAILEGRLFVPTAEWLPRSCEVIFSVMAALVFSLEHGPLTKVAALVAVTSVLVALQWLLLHSIGVFFDAFVPVFGLWLHSTVERLIGERG